MEYAPSSDSMSTASPGSMLVRAFRLGWGPQDKLDTENKRAVRAMTTWWFIPLSKWVTTLVINGISGVSPLITHLLSGMNLQVLRFAGMMDGKPELACCVMIDVDDVDDDLLLIAQSSDWSTSRM